MVQCFSTLNFDCNVLIMFVFAIPDSQQAYIHMNLWHWWVLLFLFCSFLFYSLDSNFWDLTVQFPLALLLAAEQGRAELTLIEYSLWVG